MVKKRIALFTIAFILLCATIVTVFASLYASDQDSVTATNENVFSDVNESDWFYSDVEYVNRNELMKGMSGDHFSPAATTTRGMIVTVLWRLEGEIIEEGKTFADVKSGEYYHDAVAWASNHQIVTGYNDTVFGPSDVATREQLATIIYRYAGYKEYDLTEKATLNEYIDRNQISEYAVPAIQWANANGLITGTSSNTLSPGDDVQRSQLAAILKRFCTQFADLDTNNTTDENPKMGEGNSTPADNNTDTSPSGSGSSNGGSSSSGSSGGSSTPVEGETKNTYPSIIVSSSSANPGENVQVIIKLDNNPGILGMTLSVYYDETSCTLQSVENGDALKGVLDLTSSKELNSGTRFVWDSVEISQDDIKDGSILLMNFSISNNATEGKYPITLKYSDGDIVDNNLANITPQIEDGLITITTK